MTPVEVTVLVALAALVGLIAGFALEAADLA